MDWLRGFSLGQRRGGRAMAGASGAAVAETENRLALRVLALGDQAGPASEDMAAAGGLLSPPGGPVGEPRLFGQPRGRAAPERPVRPYEVAPTGTATPSRESERKPTDWHRDTLTGLAGRPLFRDRLGQAVAMADRAERSVALLRLDLDGFMPLVERLGTAAGDNVLIEIGNRLTACSREYDTVARLVGDQFAIVQPFADQPRGVVALAERVVRMMGEPFSVDGQQVTLSARIGIALHPTDAGSPELLQRKAEMALEHARVAGQGQYRFADPDTDRRMRQGRAMADELRVALQDGELALDFRPLCDSGSLERIGGVAHLCWEHPAVGVVPPDELVRVAEEFGLIARLGLWVLEAACEAAKAWDTSLRVMVRLWPPQLRQRDLPGAVAHVLARAGLAPERLVLAIPESALAGDEPEHVLRTLEGLKARGVALAQDGVGNGSTALTQLRRFPLDLLVIDTPLVRALTEGGAGSEEAESMVRAIMALGLSLKLEVAFEGAGDGAEPDWPRAEVSAPRLAAPVDVAVPQRVGQRTSG